MAFCFLQVSRLAVQTFCKSNNIANNTILLPSKTIKPGITKKKTSLGNLANICPVQRDSSISHRLFTLVFVYTNHKCTLSTLKHCSVGIDYFCNLGTQRGDVSLEIACMFLSTHGSACSRMSAGVGQCSKGLRTLWKSEGERECAAWRAYLGCVLF